MDINILTIYTHTAKISDGIVPMQDYYFTTRENAEAGAKARGMTVVEADDVVDPDTQCSISFDSFES